MSVLRRLLVVGTSVGLLAAGLVVVSGATGLDASPAGAARCAPSSSSTRLGGVLQGEDGRWLFALIGVELFDGAGRPIGMDGCPKGGGYSTVARTNPYMLDGQGSTDGSGLSKAWSVPGIPTNARSAWIEAYPKTKSPAGKTDTSRYGIAMRHDVALPRTNLNLRLPLDCGLGPHGDSGRILGRVVAHGRFVNPSRVVTWSVAPDRDHPPLGMGFGQRETGRFTIRNLEGRQSYTVWVTIDGRTHRVEPVRVNACADTRIDVVVGRDVVKPATVAGFGDVDARYYYAKPVAWLQGRGITTGYGTRSRYAPTVTVTRGQMAAFLHRYEGNPSVRSRHRFVDVAPTAYYDRPVSWLAARGITTGVAGTNRYAPGAKLTRAQMVTFLWRLSGRPGTSRHHGFVDVPRGAYYEPAVRWAKATGLTTGIGGSNRFDPDGGLTRAQMATFLWRLADEPAPRNPGDVKNCSGFGDWVGAHAWYRIYAPHYGDVARLDDDGDGTVCEGLPWAP